MKTGVHLLLEPQHSLWERREGACVSEAEAEQQRARRRMRGGCRLPPTPPGGGEGDCSHLHRTGFRVVVFCGQLPRFISDT